ncbi:MAG: sensor histidine kinase, partial [Acidovorax sp.]|nr:sensor histidine kinase [Acidovorax sp.]
MSTARHSLRAAWAWLAEPTLMRRSVASVLVAFVVVWGVLLGYNFVNYKHAITRDPGLMKYGDAVLDSLAPVTDPAHAATAIAATDHWTNVRRRQVGLLPGVQMHELLDAASGQRVFASPGLQNVVLPPATPQAEPYIREAALQGRSFRIYTGRNARWVLRVFETKRTDSNFLQYNGRALLPYLLLASPFVLLAVWLSVRNGLRPLQQLASRIAQRGQ